MESEDKRVGVSVWKGIVWCGEKESVRVRENKRVIMSG